MEGPTYKGREVKGREGKKGEGGSPRLFPKLIQINYELMLRIK